MILGTQHLITFLAFSLALELPSAPEGQLLALCHPSHHPTPAPLLVFYPSGGLRPCTLEELHEFTSEFPSKNP